MPVDEIPLQRNGLLVDVELWASAPYRAALWKRAEDARPPVSATFLVDTGCDSTTVSEQLMRTLALEATSKTRVITGTTGAQGHKVDVFAVQLTLFPHRVQARRWSAVEVIALPLLNQSTEGLLGRDLLDQLVLHYDGPRRIARIMY